MGGRVSLPLHVPGHSTELFTPYKGMGIKEGRDAARVGAVEKWVDGDGWGWKCRTAKGQDSPGAGTRVVSTPL